MQLSAGKHATQCWEACNSVLGSKQGLHTGCTDVHFRLWFRRMQRFLFHPQGLLIRVGVRCFVVTRRHKGLRVSDRVWVMDEHGNAVAAATQHQSIISGLRCACAAHALAQHRGVEICVCSIFACTTSCRTFACTASWGPPNCRHCQPFSSRGEISSRQAKVAPATRDRLSREIRWRETQSNPPGNDVPFLRHRGLL